jgi:hypothetical protein
VHICWPYLLVHLIVIAATNGVTPVAAAKRMLETT